MKRVLLIGGARPNFMKLAPLVLAFERVGVETALVHTGQHYDPLLSDIFFIELGLPVPAYALGVGSGDRQTQTAAIVRALRPILETAAWEAVLVVGDVTSTVAATMAALEGGLPVIHVEAGLRSFNWCMAEELNRVFVDHYARWLFASEPSAVAHLKAEGIPAERIYEVGNVMVDTMHSMRSQSEASSILAQLNVQKQTYGVVTLHRAELLADEERFKEVWRALQAISKDLPLIAPLHPRTRALVTKLGLEEEKGIRLIDPLGYVDMQRLVGDARFVWTDSGGLQEETTVLGVPCFTLREETERPITIEEGTNVLVGCSKERIEKAYREGCNHPKTGRIPALWDGQAAHRIAKVIAQA